MPSITQGLLNALGRTAASSHKCTSCGITMPVYSGRYPSKCPNCGNGEVVKYDTEGNQVSSSPSVTADELMAKIKGDKKNNAPRISEAVDKLVDDSRFIMEFDARIERADNLRIMYERKLAGEQNV